MKGALRELTRGRRRGEHPTSSNDNPQPPQRRRQNFEFQTAELNVFLEKNDLNLVKDAVKTLREQHNDVAALEERQHYSDVAGLLDDKLDPYQYGYGGPGRVLAGPGRLSDSSAVSTEDKDDTKLITPAEIVKIIQDESTPASFNNMYIELVSMDNATHKAKEVGEAMSTDSDFCKRTGTIEWRILRARIAGERKEASFFMQDGKAEEAVVYSELCKIGAIQNKPLNTRRLKAALKEAVAGVLNSGSDMQYTHGLVATEPPNPNLNVATNDVTKARVLVVAGESGAGKSRYAVGALSGGGRTSLLRYSLKADDFDRAKAAAQTETQEANSKNEAEKKVDLSFQPPPQDDSSEILRTLIELVTSELFHFNLAGATMYNSVRGVAKALNKDRNDWAFEKAKEMLDTAIASVGCPEVKRWYESRENKDGAAVKLDELVVVFDECGSSPDFVSGIIAIARERFLPLLSKLAKQVGLVLCGSGLEAVKIGTIRNKYLGSDPALTDVVIMKTTELAKLPEHLQDLGEAIEKGVHSRVLAGNARMLTQGVIPVHLSDVVAKYVVGNDASLLQRRIAVGSFRYLMDYCVRRYVNLNVLASTSADKREQLLAHSFRFLMRSELLKIKDANPAAAQLLPDVGKDNDEDLFRMGLATRDVGRTSNALKYLACHGATHYPHKANGFAFEAVLAAHLERYFKAVHGIPVASAELKHAWPPVAEKNAKLDVRDIKGRLDEMVKEGGQDIKDIVGFIKSLESGGNNKAAIVLRQGVPNAQGADVLLFELEFTRSAELTRSACQLELWVFQAKGWSKTKYASNMEEAAKSIGIKTDRNHSTDRPQKGSAGYSYKATQRLLKALTEGLKHYYGKVKSTLKKRAIVVAYGHSDRSGTDTDGFGGLSSPPELWTREMLEPTISALAVAPAS